MKKIFSLTSDRGFGGISASLLTYSRAMALSGIKHVIALPNSTPVYDDLAALGNVELIPISSTALRLHSLSQFRFSSEIRAHMEESDCIFVHNAKHANMPPKYRGKTYVINHNGKTNRLDSAPNIIFLNSMARQKFLERFPSLTTHNIVMGHGFDVFPEIKRELQKEFPVQIISAGRVMEKKGYRELVETARLLQEAQVNCHISIYGEGPDETHLKQRIADYGLTNITIRPWTNDVRGAMAAADIFCTPSHGESFPLVIGEALEAGLAIASTRTNGAREYFSYADDDKPIGLLSDIHDFEGMAEILTTLVNDSELRQAMNKNARQFLLDNFSLEILAEKFTALCNATSKRPRIFIATQTFPPRVGGMENVMKALAENFAQSGYDVTVLPNWPYKTPASFRSVHMRLIKPLRIIAKRLTLKLMLHNDDVVICDSWKSINVVTRRFTGRLVILAHGQEYLKGNRRRATIETALQRASLVVASSSFTADLVKSGYEIDAAKLSVIPPTYMLGETPAPVQSANGSAQDTQVRLVSVCRLDERKGLMQALTALHEEETIKTDWRWDIIGNGPQAEPLKGAVQTFGMAERVCFHHEVGDSDKSLMLGQADLFVMPSFRKGHSVEGFGISHVEAAQYGLPAIAGAIGGSVDAVLDGETGWCVDANDARQIGQALAEAINMADERHRRGQAAHERFTAEFVGAAVFNRFATQALNSKKN